ncbi:hypothetical protein J6590_101014 [Homalodisca vitripennis]|nr:hypothetical protein J6590_101014 [Homalodisca vitripennis]
MPHHHYAEQQVWIRSRLVLRADPKPARNFSLRGRHEWKQRHKTANFTTIYLELILSDIQNFIQLFQTCALHSTIIHEEEIDGLGPYRIQHLNPTTPSGKGGSSRLVPPCIRDAALAPPGISTPSGFDVTAGVLIQRMDMVEDLNNTPLFQGGAYSVHGRDPVTN